MKEIYILTRCVAIKEGFCHFHFNGFYFGMMIKKIVSSLKDEKIKIGDDYLIKGKVIQLNNDQLVIEIIRIKNLDEVKIIPQK